MTEAHDGAAFLAAGAGVGAPDLHEGVGLGGADDWYAQGVNDSKVLGASDTAATVVPGLSDRPHTYVLNTASLTPDALIAAAGAHQARVLCEYHVIETISSAGRKSAALRAACHALAHGPYCPCPPAKPDKHQLTRWQHAVEGLLKLPKALSKMLKRNPAGHEKEVARLRGQPFRFDFHIMCLEPDPVDGIAIGVVELVCDQSRVLIKFKGVKSFNSIKLVCETASPSGVTPAQPHPAHASVSVSLSDSAPLPVLRRKHARSLSSFGTASGSGLPVIGSPDMLTGRALELYIDQEERAEAARLENLELRRLGEEAVASFEACVITKESGERAHALEQSRSIRSLALLRFKFKEERSLRGEAQQREQAAESHTTDALRQQDAELRSNNSDTHDKATKSLQLQAKLDTLSCKRDSLAAALLVERDKRKVAEARALSEQDAAVELARERSRDVRSNNSATNAKATKSVQLQAQLDTLSRKRDSLATALVVERDKRKVAEARALSEQDAAVELARERSRDVRSSNQHTQQALTDATRCIEQLSSQLQHARQQKSVIVASKLEAELAEAKGRLQTLNKANATLRQRVASSGLTEAEAEVRAANARTSELETKLSNLERHLLELGESEDKEQVNEKAVAAHKQKIHGQALRRSREKGVELKKTKGELKELTETLHALLAEHAKLRLESDARYEELMRRVDAGEARNESVIAEWRSTCELARAEAKHSALKHALTLGQLAGQKKELDAYRNFQAKEGGQYKASVRLCYYKLIDMKVPTNQIEEVVRQVLGMLGSKAEHLPKRSTAQHMRREMEHCADVVAGVELAKAHHVTGASDDTTKRQRTLAADLTHHRLPDGSIRTLCIGLSCMSRGTAEAKADHFEKRMKQVFNIYGQHWQ